jgi:HPt (histidine-containing phosphotransfer) domain-containing protein
MPCWKVDMTEFSNESLALVASPSIADTDPPIDTAHLGRMTLGERSLEVQVLELFDRQADLLLARMREVTPQGVAGLAHTLTGSARGIGAWRVAAAAEALERAVADGGELAPVLEQLSAAVGEARLAICAMLRVSAAAAAQQG